MSSTFDAGGLDTPVAQAAVSARLRAFSRTGDPRVLWPGLQEHARIAALREIERVTRTLLRGALGVRIDPSSAHTTYALLIAGHTSGMGPQLARSIDAGAVVAEPSLARGLAEQLAHARLRAKRMVREVLPALDALSEMVITPVVLKGFHTSHAYFDEPGLRRMSDVDVLIPPGLIGRAEDALRSVGFRATGAARRPYKRDWIGPAVSEEIFSVEREDERSRWNLELHASLDRVFHPGAVARLNSEVAHVEPALIAGRSVSVLRSPLLLLTLACHCSQELDASRLLRLVEIVRLVRADRASGRLEWDEFLAMLRRTGSACYTYPAFALVEELAPGTIDERVLALGRRTSTRAARHTVSRLVPAGGSPDRLGASTKLMWTRGPLGLMHRVLRAVWPASGWRLRLRRICSGLLSLSAPDERRSPGAHELSNEGRGA